MYYLLMKPSYILPLIYIFLFTILALASLEAFPIFADEAIYLFWVQKILGGIAHPFISLYDGKPPLFIWLSALGSMDGSSLLLSGRTISVMAYGATLTLLFFSIKKQSLTWAWIALLLTSLSPFVFFHSRLAIMDSLLTMFLTAAILTWTFSTHRFRGLLTGIFLGLAFWTKTPTLFLIPFPILSVLLFERNKTNFKQALIAFGVSLAAILSLRISVWFPFLFNRAGDFTYPISAILSGQLKHIPTNFYELLYWLSAYRLWPVILISLLSLGLALKEKNKLVLNLVLACICFSVPFVLLGKVLSPRYYLLLGILLPVIAGFSLSKLNKRLSMTASVLLASLYIPFIFTLLATPLSVNLPAVDKDQYLQNWASGIGIREASEFFIDEAKNGSVQILSEGYFGTLPDGLFVEIGDKIKDLPLQIDGVGENGSPNYYRKLTENTADSIFYIGNHDRINQATLDELELILSYSKVDGGPALEVYKVKR